MNHCDENDFWELHYVGRCVDMETRSRHIEECLECSAKLERLSADLRCSRPGTAASEIPETFWTRQRLATMRQIGTRLPRERFEPKRLAVAAALAIATFGAVWSTRQTTPAERPRTEQAVTRPASAASVAPIVSQPEGADPWTAAGLGDFQELVAWEEWAAREKESAL